MSQITIPAPQPSVFAQMLQDEPLFVYAGLAMLILCGPTLMALAVETRTFQGANPWIKPLKFELSLALFFLTLAFFARYLPEGMTATTGYRAFAAVVVACAVIEMMWIGGAAAFATASHFNTTPAMASIYGLMGLVAVVLTSVTLVYGVAMLVGGRPSPIVTAVGLSLVLTFVLTVVIAFRLASNGGPVVGAAELGHSLPFLGWSMEAGDLRVPHFFATHAMQFVPVLAIVLSLAATSLLTHTTAIALNGAYALFTFAIFAQALAGHPFVS